MRVISTSLAVAAALGVAACNNPNRPTDVGSMQEPTPRGGFVTQGRVQPDTGSMQEPVASGGAIRAEPSTPDTGSMALPSAAQGNSAPRRR